MSKQRAKDVLREEQKTAALRLWMAGVPFRTMAEHLGVSLGTAYTRVKDAIDDMRPHGDWDRYRAVQLAELEVARYPLRASITAWRRGDTIDDCVKAIGMLLKLQEREAKLLGLDRVESTFDELSGLSDAQLADIVEGWTVDAEAGEREDA